MAERSATQAVRADGPAQPLSARMTEGPPDIQALYREHFRFVWRCLRRLGVLSAGMDDAVQEVFLVAHRRSADF